MLPESQEYPQAGCHRPAGSLRRRRPAGACSRQRHRHPAWRRATRCDHRLHGWEPLPGRPRRGIVQFRESPGVGEVGRPGPYARAFRAGAGEGGDLAAAGKAFVDDLAADHAGGAVDCDFHWIPSIDGLVTQPTYPADTDRCKGTELPYGYPSSPQQHLRSALRLPRHLPAHRRQSGLVDRPDTRWWPVRFTHLRKMVSPVTSKVLTPTLRALERDGLISRTVHPPVPPRVDYGLTELDPSLLDPLTLLRDCAENHVPSIL